MSVFSAFRVAMKRFQSDYPPSVCDPSLMAEHLPSEDADFMPIWTHCRPCTMISFARGLAVYRAVRYLVENGVGGDFVECGVWRGGASMIAMMSLLHFGAANRRFSLFDTFQGVTEPSVVDVDWRGASAQSQLESENGKVDGVLCYASLAEAMANVATTGYPSDLIEFAEGDIRETALRAPRREIAFLRLDTDFYDSTRVELETFYPMLIEKGVLIVDDYGHWNGARVAVDEYFDSMHRAGRHCPLLTVTDYTGRLAVK